jgi:hypothetical protein
VRLNNGDILLYDGIQEEGRTQRQTLPPGEEFPSIFISNNQQAWSAHTVWFERVQILPNINNNRNLVQNNTPAPMILSGNDIINLEDDISQSSAKVQKREQRNTSTIKCNTKAYETKSKSKDIKKKNHKSKEGNRRNKKKK